MEPDFKTENGPEYEAKLTDEYHNNLDPRLWAFVWWATLWLFRYCGIKLTITCVNRTKEENDLAGGSKWSAHLVGRAVDIRVHGLTDEELWAFTQKVGEMWGDLIYCIVHGIGANRHIHVNIRYAYHKKVYA